MSKRRKPLDPMAELEALTEADPQDIDRVLKELAEEQRD